MTKLQQFCLNDEEVTFIVNFLRDNAHNPENKLDRNWIQDLSNKIEDQIPKTKLFAMTAPGFECPDFVYAETREQAIIKWGQEIVLVEVTEIEED